MTLGRLVWNFIQTTKLFRDKATGYLTNTSHPNSTSTLKRVCRITPTFKSLPRPSLKSVPNYTHVQELAETFSYWFTFPSSTVIDFGASTGETLRRIKRRHTKELTLIGYDNSQAMIEQAKLKGIDITFADLEKPFELPELSYGVALYTLQFLRPNSRYDLLKRIYRKLSNSGALFIVEKVLGSTAQMQDILQQLYWEMKAKNGFTSEQIINKAKALRGCMYPKTVSDNEAEFKSIGFNFEIVFKESQFCGWLLTKSL